jgi:hypothetical protein
MRQAIAALVAAQTLAANSDSRTQAPEDGQPELRRRPPRRTRFTVLLTSLGKATHPGG